MSTTLPAARFPTRAVAIALLSMAILTLVSFAASMQTQSKAEVLANSQIIVLTRAERLRQLGDEAQLTARLAVHTGERVDADHYRQTRPQLREALVELQRAISLPDNAKAAIAADVAESRRSRIEEAALQLAGRGNREGAKELLNSARYAELSGTYSAAIASIINRSRGYVAQLREDVERFSFWSRLANLVGIPLIIVAWLFIVGPARRWGKEMDQARALSEAAAQAKSNFLATMSHEVRTPLNSILGFTQLLLDDGKLTDQQRHRLELVHNSGDALLTVVNDILDYSAIEAGKLTLHEETFSLAGLVDNCVSIIRGEAEGKGLRLRIEIDPELGGYYRGDPHRLRQVLLNLLNNAVKFTEKGHVTLSVAQEAGADEHACGDRVRFCVTDTGPGIPAERQSQLFSEFTQADSSITRRYGGSGLGLAICRRLARLMGGDMRLDSSPGVGSSFWFTVPLPKAAPPALEESRASGAVATEGARILLVEDVAVNQELACAMLRHMGYEVHTADDGLQAIEAVRSGDYDLVLMDIQMPGMDGMAAARAIRQLPEGAAHIPIIALTANVLPQHVRQYRAAGMDGHIAKPILKAELRETLARHLTARAASPERTPGSGTSMRPDVPPFDSQALERLCELLPKTRVDAHLATLLNDLAAFVEAGADAPELSAQAHKLVSVAGQLGFSGVSKACRELEQTDPADRTARSAAFAEARAAASAAAAKIAELRAA